MGFDFLRTTVMNQVWLFENLRTTVINSKNRPDNQQGFSANSNTHPALVNSAS